ncbi:PhzF family phenazine biosynthesis isomerase [Klugiella xanthotipulae]|uniref:PhzF family phenazine biosynthesis protein n=1 Tax=Klugiella xanthotipulae TaxID=244735 RepID=A0A543I6Y6_9MICO|nr:PhzF family phenazine biosynthesis protein [Klugiella xanthotipulae]TQM66366.1 PhzF family phenazine biosynthesis protein [Klugiella xanthotipulae]
MTVLSSALRYAAFTTRPEGGNPAGIVLDAAALGVSEMQEIAAQIGYAETAFLTERSVGGDPRRSRVRYFSPVAEVPFCGHATVATAAALAEREGEGTFTFDTAAGPVVIETADTVEGLRASFTSVEPQQAPLDAAAFEALLAVLGLTRADLNPVYPPGLSYAGNWHPVIVIADPLRFDTYTFDFSAVRDLKETQGWTGTITTLRELSPAEFVARNPFAAGRVREDPATGSAAAAVGAYLRAIGRVTAPARVLIHQGEHVGRPSLLTVDIPPSGGIIVTGSAVEIPASPAES